MSNINAYCGYSYEIPEKFFKVSFTSSYDSTSKYNCSNTMIFKIKDVDVYLSFNEVYELMEHMRDMTAISERIPNKDNTSDHLSL